MVQEPCIAASAGHTWRNVFWEDFTDPGCMAKSFRHPMGWGKWKWDAQSNKEIHWEPACAQIVTDESGAHAKPILRVCVFSDWFHRIDRLATKQKFGYGFYEARCRFKGAEGMHSAFWLLPEGMWDDPVPPGEIVGGIEVDVVENRGRDGNRKDISWQGNTAVHWGGYGAHHRSVAYKQMNLPDSPGRWATFGLLHEPGGMRWYWNGREVNSARVWSPMPNSIYFSTEVNESGGWAGQDMSSYGPLDNPAGWIEIDHCGFWERSWEDEADNPHSQLSATIIPYRDPALPSPGPSSSSPIPSLPHTFTVRHTLTVLDLEHLRDDCDEEHSWFVPFPLSRVIRHPQRAQTLLSLGSKQTASPGTQFALVNFESVEVQEVCATGLWLRYSKSSGPHISPHHELRVDVMVHDGGLVEQEARESREKMRIVEERVEELAAELRELKALVQNTMGGTLRT